MVWYQRRKYTKRVVASDADFTYKIPYIVQIIKKICLYIKHIKTEIEKKKIEMTQLCVINVGFSAEEIKKSEQKSYIQHEMGG